MIIAGYPFIRPMTFAKQLDSFEITVKCHFEGD